jgi:adenine-specific DNA-methyltransferase
LEPHLVDHLVSRLREFGLHPASDRIRDAAAGGAAFLMPLARMKVEAWKAEKASGAEIIRKSRSQLIGREIEQGLASLANALLRRMPVEDR